MQNTLCAYYLARTDRQRTWFVNGAFRNEFNMCLERCLDKRQSLFEFFVPASMEQRFLAIAQHLLDHGYLLSLEKKTNRFLR
jgi:hypothetical protein